MAAGKQLLVVEDMPLAQEIVRLTLQAAGHRIDLAENGADAVETLKRHPYDLVLMDLDMPVMDGYAASKAIRELPSAGRWVPVLALSATTGDGEAERCRQAGMNGYLPKPFKTADLLREVEHWIESGLQAPSPAPVWDRAAYRELADRLGPDRMKTVLTLFVDHMARSLSAIRAAPQDDAVLDRETHGIVSTAGMLGFADLSAASRRMMTAPPEVRAILLNRDRLIQDLEDAAERVSCCLSAETHAALA